MEREAPLRRPPGHRGSSATSATRHGAHGGAGTAQALVRTRHGSARAGIEPTRHVGIALDELHEAVHASESAAADRSPTATSATSDPENDGPSTEAQRSSARSAGASRSMRAATRAPTVSGSPVLRLFGPLDSRKLLEEERVPGTALGDRLQLLSGERPPCSGLDQGPRRRLREAAQPRNVIAGKGGHALGEKPAADRPSRRAPATCVGSVAGGGAGRTPRPSTGRPRRP